MPVHGLVTGPMRERSKRWLWAATAISVTDAAVLLAAGLVLPAAEQLHASGAALVAAILSDVGSLVPGGVTAGLGAILSVFGAGWWQQHLVSPALASDSGTGATALAGVLASPVYAIVRRGSGAQRAPAGRSTGAPPHRIYVAVGSIVGPVPPPRGSGRGRITAT